MEYVDNVKFSCNGIKLVNRKYGDIDNRNGLYIIDEDTGKVLNDFIPYGKYHIKQGRYIVISHNINYGVDRITVYDCLEKKLLANDYKCRLLYWNRGSWIYSISDIYIVTFPDGKEHLLDFNLLGTNKDVFGVGADNISVLFVNEDTYQLGITVNEEIKLYDKCKGIIDSNILKNYSLVKANISDCYYGQNIHVLKNKNTGIMVLVEAEISNKKKIDYKFDSIEYDNIYFLDFDKDMVGSLHLSCFEKNGKVSDFYHDYIVSSIDELRKGKVFEVEGSNVGILDYIDTDEFMDSDYRYEIYFSYTNKLGKKGILKFMKKSNYKYDGILSYETSDDMIIDFVPRRDLNKDDFKLWLFHNRMAIPIFNGEKKGIYSYESNSIVLPTYINIIPLISNCFFCYKDDKYFDIIEIAGSRGKENEFLLRNCEIVYKENDKEIDNVIIFKDSDGKYGLFYSDLVRIFLLNDIDEVIIHENTYKDCTDVRNSFSLKKDGKFSFFYEQQIAYNYCNYVNLDDKFDNIEVYNKENVTIAKLGKSDNNYRLEIVSCFPRKPIVNSSQWKEFLSLHQREFEEIVVCDNYIFLRDRNTFSARVYSLNSGLRIGDFSFEVVIKKEDNKVIFIDGNNSYIYDNDIDSIVLIDKMESRDNKLRKVLKNS